MQLSEDGLRVVRNGIGKRHYTHTMYYWMRSFCGIEMMGHALPIKPNDMAPVTCKRCLRKLDRMREAGDIR